MNADSAHVTAAHIARMAGVTRAAVSNWRRRHPDFPRQAAGGASNPLFDLAEVEGWLTAQQKGQDVSDEVRLWQLLDGHCGGDMLRALEAVALNLAGDANGEPLDLTARSLVNKLAKERSPGELLANLTDRLALSNRDAAACSSRPNLVRFVRHFADAPAESVYDPACGTGGLLFGVSPSENQQLQGQDINPCAVRIATAHASLNGRFGTISLGDSLRDSKVSRPVVDLVVCHPPFAVSDWDPESFLVDTRWEFGLPPRSESELAWLQHCYSHTEPGGHTMVVMPTAAAYRKAGRRIRAEMIRQGALRSVVALPAGLASNHSLSMHLWVLERPRTEADSQRPVRMVDLTSADPAGLVVVTGDQTVDVPLIKLLDEHVDLSPTRYVTTAPPDYLAQYAMLRGRLDTMLGELTGLLPELRSGPGALDTPQIRITDLGRAGLVDAGELRSYSEQIDDDYLRGFAKSPANVRRGTAASGTYRADPRSAVIPQMPIDRQRDYGMAFRSIDEFDRRLKDAARLGREAAQLAREGLTSGALNPVTAPRKDEE